jgi:formiminotetrahydrofolate cyclodeaminase
MELEGYLAELASAAPTPGGGSAATLVGALGAALVAMVARITMDNPRSGAIAGEARALADAADRLRAAYLAARPADESAFAAVVRAQGLPRTTEVESAVRTERLQAALSGAAEAPLAVAELTADAMALAARAAALENRHLMSDVECAVAFFRAAFDAAVANVRVNHAYLKDTALIAQQRERISTAGHAVERAAAEAAAAFMP